MLKEQLSQQIVTDAEELTKGFKDTNDYEAGIIQGYKEGYEDAGEKYAALWQAAEEKAANYEKALKDFANKLNEVCGQNGIITAGIHFIIDDMMMFEITHKTGEDEKP